MVTTARVQEANSLTLATFIDRYCDSIATSSWKSHHLLSLETSASITEDDLLACFTLLRYTSADAYKASSTGWSRSSKLKEMRLPNMKYLLLKEIPVERDASPGSHTEKLIGFSSFMIVVEDDIEVVYCYEVHLQPEYQGRGLGPKLMHVVESIGRAVGLDMAMLTVFTSNSIADRLYRRMGYELYDEEPLPAARRLRNRKMEQPKPTFIILAKSLK